MATTDLFTSGASLEFLLIAWLVLLRYGGLFVVAAWDASGCGSEIQYDSRCEGTWEGIEVVIGLFQVSQPGITFRHPVQADASAQASTCSGMRLSHAAQLPSLEAALPGQ